MSPEFRFDGCLTGTAGPELAGQQMLGTDYRIITAVETKY
jgi:hypothetical protein